ncbi:DUF5994 family protein [Actinacidiphila rubida]|uniref:DUF5994 family protein n=1 Tax=Actinacidiphila rubida TaxID=310780 RepID=UPI000849B466|nr:DUF5994 family protein [Actinacidiphila rubida]
MTERLLPGLPGDGPARVRLGSLDDAPQRLDGTWWPRSYDLGRELPPLIAALDSRWPGITRVTVCRTMWRIQPDSVTVGDREVHIKRSGAVPHPHTICLLAYGIGRCDLLVTPPGAQGPG